MAPKTYTIAGTTLLNGVHRIRVANGTVEGRIKALIKHGDEDIRLLTLPNEMTKQEAVEFIIDLPDFNTAPIQTLLADFLANVDTKVTKKVKSVETPVAVVDDDLDAITYPDPFVVDTVDEELEDLPY